MDEVRLPVQKVYRILEIHEVYDNQVTQYNPETGDRGLFVKYINTFLKLKAETSGYHGWVRSPVDEDRYVELFWQSEGISLDTECIRFSTVKRGLVKLCLNSMWGKLKERNDRTMTKTITEHKELYGFLATLGMEVVNTVFASDVVVWLSWKRGAEEDMPNLRHTNEVIYRQSTMHKYV